MDVLVVEESLKGFKYLYGKELEQTKKVIDICISTLGKRNFEQVVTPIVVDYKHIVGDSDRPVSLKKSDIVFDFQTNDSERLALRYENTLPICKFYIDNFTHIEPHPLKKFCYISPQFRNEKDIVLHGRLRQFFQIGWEVIGGNKESFIADSIKAGDKLLHRLNLEHIVKISEVNILGEVFQTLSISREERHVLLAVFDDKQLQKLKQILVKGNYTNIQKRLLTLLLTFYSKTDLKKAIKDLKYLLRINGNKDAVKRVNRVVRLFKRLKKLQCKNTSIDFSLVRSNKFYSGLIFQFYVGKNDHECGGGGEYNRIIKSLGGPDSIACGGAFGLERITHEYKKSKND